MNSINGEGGGVRKNREWPVEDRESDEKRKRVIGIVSKDQAYWDATYLKNQYEKELRYVYEQGIRFKGNNIVGSYIEFKFNEMEMIERIEHGDAMVDDEKKPFETFIECLEKLFKDKNMMKRFMKPYCTREKDQFSKQSSILMLLNGSPEFQAAIINVILKFIVYYERSGDGSKQFADNIGVQLMEQLKMIPNPSHPEMTQQILNTLNTLSVIPMKQRFISYIPDMIRDQDHPEMVEILIEKLEEDSELTLAIMDCLGALQMEPNQLKRAIQVVKELITSIELPNVPVMVKFLLQCEDKEDVKLVIHILRNDLDLNELLDTSDDMEDEDEEEAEGGEDKHHYISLCLDALFMGLQCNKLIQKAIMQEIEQIEKPENHTMLDVIVLIMANHIAGFPQHNFGPMMTVKKKIAQGYLQRTLIQDTIVKHGSSLDAYLGTIISMADSLVRANSSLYNDYGELIYKSLFTYSGTLVQSFVSMQLQRLVLSSLEAHIGSRDELQTSCALNVIQSTLQAELCLDLQSFENFFNKLLDHIQSFTDDQIRVWYHIYIHVGSLKLIQQDSLSILDAVHMLIRKQLSNQDIAWKRLGVIGACQYIQFMLKSSLKNKFQSIMETLIERLFECGEANMHCMIIFFDEMTLVLEKIEKHDGTLDVLYTKANKLFGETMLTRYTEVKDYPHLYSKLVSPFSSPTSLYVVNFVISLPTDYAKKWSMICCLKLLRSIERISKTPSTYKDMVTTPLLVCPLTNLKKQSILTEHEIHHIFESLFCAYNWIKEVINGFIDDMTVDQMKSLFELLQQIESHLDICLNISKIDISLLLQNHFHMRDQMNSNSMAAIALLKGNQGSNGKNHNKKLSKAVANKLLPTFSNLTNDLERPFEPTIVKCLTYFTEDEFSMMTLRNISIVLLFIEQNPSKNLQLLLMEQFRDICALYEKIFKNMRQEEMMKDTIILIINKIHFVLNYMIQEDTRAVALFANNLPMEKDLSSKSENLCIYLAAKLDELRHFESLKPLYFAYQPMCSIFNATELIHKKGCSKIIFNTAARVLNNNYIDQSSRGYKDKLKKFIEAFNIHSETANSSISILTNEFSFILDFLKGASPAVECQMKSITIHTVSLYLKLVFDYMFYDCQGVLVSSTDPTIDQLDALEISCNNFICMLRIFKSIPHSSKVKWNKTLTKLVDIMLRSCTDIFKRFSDGFLPKLGRSNPIVINILGLFNESHSLVNDLILKFKLTHMRYMPALEKQLHRYNYAFRIYSEKSNLEVQATSQTMSSQNFDQLMIDDAVSEDEESVTSKAPKKKSKKKKKKPAKMLELVDSDDETSMETSHHEEVEEDTGDANESDDDDDIKDDSQTERLKRFTGLTSLGGSLSQSALSISMSELADSDDEGAVNITNPRDYTLEDDFARL